MGEVRVEIVGEKIGLVVIGGYVDSYTMRQFTARWDKENKMWLMPLRFDICLSLRRTFGKQLKIGPELNKWGHQARKQETELKSIVAAGEAKLKIGATHEYLAKAMSDRTYQQVGAAFIARQRRALIADEPGLGKTLEAIAGLIEADCWKGLILVIAPLTSLRPVWQREMARFAPDAHTVIGVPLKQDSADARTVIISKFVDHYVANPAQPHMLVVNPDMLRGEKFPLLSALDWQAIIIDESHKYLSGVKSKQKMTQTGKGILGLKVLDDGVKVALSGTPMRGKPANMWGTLHWLRPDQYSSFYSWAQRYLIVTSNRYSRFVVGDINPYREDELYRSLDDIMLRRTKAEVVQELPPKQRIDVICDMTARQQEMYTAMARDAAAELVDMEEDDSLSAIGVLAIMTRLKQFANCAWRATSSSQPVALFEPTHSGKAAVIEEMLIERGIAGDDREGSHKIVIASQFTQVIDSCEAWLNSIKVDTLKITGAVKESDRTRITEQWQSEGGPRVLLMNTMAGGVSITLDAYCDELIIIDETWTPDDQEQLEDRIHRVSRIHQVTIYRMKCKDTIDEYIASVTDRKEMVQKEILDGRRGVDNIIRAISS